MLIRYVGNHASVEIAGTGQIVARGETVEVPPSFGASLVRQTSWEPVTPKPKPKKSRKD